MKCTGNGVGSFCDFYCNEDYELDGSETIECEALQNGAAWSRDVPVCRKSSKLNLNVLKFSTSAK